MILLGNILAWLLLWFGGWYGWVKMLKRGMNYITSYRITTLYFIFLSFISWRLYHGHLSAFFSSLPAKVMPIYFLIFFFVLLVSIYFFSHRIFDKTLLASQFNRKIFAATMDYRFLFAKSFDILFQQISFLILVLLLKDVVVGTGTIVIFSGLIFGIVHLPLLILRHHVLVPYFVIASFFAGIIFSFLIVTLPYGFIYAYCLHWSFYIGVGIYYNMHILKKRKKEYALTS